MRGPRSMQYSSKAKIHNPNVSADRGVMLMIIVIALSILDRLVTTRWKVLPKEQSQGIRNYIVSVMIKTSSDEAVMQKERTYLNKLNLTLVAVCYRYRFLLICRFSNRTGQKIGQHSSQKLCRPARLTCRSVRTIW